MAIQIASTTDTKEAVSAALADKPVVDESSAPAKAKADETPAASETVEESSEETQDDETTTEDGEEEELEAKSDDKKPKKSNGFKKRIDKLQKQMSQKEQELEYWRQEALKAKREPEKTGAKPKNTSTEATGKPKAEDFDTHDEYVEALTDWKLEQREKAKEAKEKETQVKTEFQKRAEAFQSRISKFKESAPDFDDLMEETTVDVPLHVQEVFLDSEYGPALMYELAKDQKELERISKLPPIAAALALGKLEAKLAKSDDSPTPKEAKTPKAPPPIAPVTGKGGSIKKSIDDPNLSQRDFERLREEQIRARRV